ncbi:hypothetical protein RRG08_000397 [Elysia crispata]|uniref:Uncharacterized protein n=1 Tax=Elysia crispata TaxID=231223 RepID=A0AAE0ZV08_9GAST|nr:hypothetical protein RRG08_000397 [Elysia crispata]
MNVPGDRQGYIGDITTKSLSELRELLERKERLLADRSLLQKLPDKGRKAHEFVQKVKELIEKKSQEYGSNMQVCGTSATNVDQPSTSSVSERMTGLNIVASDRAEAKQKERDTHSINLLDTAGLLSDHFQNISLGTELGNAKTEQESNSYEKIIQRDNDSLMNKKRIPKFVPNKPLKPEDTHGSESEAAHCTMEKHRKEESAVCPPQYKHQKSKLIPLSESIQLTLEQQKKREVGCMNEHKYLNHEVWVAD